MSTTNSDKHLPVNVLMVVQSLPPTPSGGAELQALRLAQKLIEHGINVKFITPGFRGLKGSFIVNGVPVYRLHSSLNYILDLLFLLQRKAPAPKTVIEYDDSVNNYNVISRKIGIGAKLRYKIFISNARDFLKNQGEKFDIIHSHTIEWPGYAAAVLSREFRKRLIVKDSTMNGITNILRFPDGQEKQRLIIEQAHFVAMTTTIWKNLVAAGVKAENITMIPNGIDLTGPSKTVYNKAETVLFVGNLYQQPAKGVDILLKAWVIVLASVPSAKLEIVGDGDLEAYRNYCSELSIQSSVIFHGRRQDVPELMTMSDVFVLPSRREGMPNVLMEAILRGLPCVATEVSGSQDLIQDGANGLLVKVADYRSLAEKIIYLLEHRDKAELMGRKARQDIINRYDLDTIAREYIELYKKV